MSEVYAGRAIYISYLSGLSVEIYQRYTTGSGKPLVYLSPVPIFARKEVGFGFNKISPWRERFEQVLYW